MTAPATGPLAGGPPVCSKCKRHDVDFRKRKNGQPRSLCRGCESTYLTDRRRRIRAGTWVPKRIGGRPNPFRTIVVLSDVHLALHDGAAGIEEHLEERVCDLIAQHLAAMQMHGFLSIRGPRALPISGGR